MSLVATTSEIAKKSRVEFVQAITKQSTALSNRQRFLAAAQCQDTDRPPVWMMRQAGRVLPEYRALKERYSFVELVRTPELAAEVTLQPIRRFGFDAAILFSDILVVPEAMGQAYRFRDGGGIEMDFAVTTREDVQRLSTEDLEEKLNYVSQALHLIRPELESKTALLGFAGAPWTLANFMLEGGSNKNHTKALELFRSDRPLFDLLMQKLTKAVSAFLKIQIAAGVDAVQIFDSLGGLLPANDFEAASGQWIRKIIKDINRSVPTLVFSKGTHDWETLLSLGAQGISIGPEMDLTDIKHRIPNGMAIQGNLDPNVLLNEDSSEVRSRTKILLEAMRGRSGYIFNLGHGVPPAARLENIATVIETVRSFV